MWFVSTAFAATGLGLPPGEDPERWQGAASLAGITVGCAPGATCVTVTVLPDAWALAVDGREGRVAPPLDEPGRAAVAWLAASLARPMPEPDAPPAPPPFGLDVTLSGGGLLQGEVAPTLTGALGVRLHLAALAVEAGVASASPSALDFDPAWSQSRADARLGGLGSPLPWLAVGAGVSASSRSWADGGVAVGNAWVPAVDAVVEARLVGPRLDGALRLTTGLDLRSVQVARGEDHVGPIGPFSVSLSAGVALHAWRR